MVAIQWEKIKEQEFTGDEAREASDFYEVLYNFQLEPQLLYDLFHEEKLTVSQRLVLIMQIPLACAKEMLVKESDTRICKIIETRLSEGDEPNVSS